MSATKPGDGWKASDAGILLPPGADAKPTVQRAEFALKVTGFSNTEVMATPLTLETVQRAQQRILDEFGEDPRR